MVGVIPGAAGQAHVVVALQTSLPEVRIKVPERVDLLGTLTGTLWADRPLLAASLVLIDALGIQHAFGLEEQDGDFTFAVQMVDVAPGPAFLSAAVIDETGNPGAATASLLIATDAPYLADLRVRSAWQGHLSATRPYRVGLAPMHPYRVSLTALPESEGTS